MTENTEKDNFGKLSIDDKLDFMFAELLSVKQQMNNRNMNNNQFNHKPNFIRSDCNSNRRYANHQRSYRKNSNNNFNGNKKFNNKYRFNFSNESNYWSNLSNDKYSSLNFNYNYNYNNGYPPLKPLNYSYPQTMYSGPYSN